jgi:hypothetical protein
MTRPGLAQSAQRNYSVSRPVITPGSAADHPFGGCKSAALGAIHQERICPRSRKIERARALSRRSKPQRSAAMSMTSTGRLRAAVIGGLSAANALRRRGLGVTVFEQARALGEVGAGVFIYPNKRARH